MNVAEAIAVIDKHVSNPTDGLPDEIFYFVSEMTPLVNVDLLIKDENGRTLLAWRNDKYAGEGWHVPGGIIRLKETMKQRLQKVAETEIGTKVEFELNPIAINELIVPRKTRCHFVSFLYKCRPPKNFVPENKGLKKTDPGYLMWHSSCPDNLIECQKIYKENINRNI
tara:strand:+ start:118 stop:621 length:504 start_codon:yes stop_codon:yes gene_type:complete